MACRAGRGFTLAGGSWGGRGGGTGDAGAGRLLSDVGLLAKGGRMDTS